MKYRFITKDYRNLSSFFKSLDGLRFVWRNFIFTILVYQLFPHLFINTVSPIKDTIVYFAIGTFFYFLTVFCQKLTLIPLFGYYITFNESSLLIEGKKSARIETIQFKEILRVEKENFGFKILIKKSKVRTKWITLFYPEKASDYHELSKKIKTIEEFLNKRSVPTESTAAEN